MREKTFGSASCLNHCALVHVTAVMTQLKGLSNHFQLRDAISFKKKS